eukprot:CAMPEP_0119314704 /NCGR_PEP_ID=MMETSP1333-20130426/33735_1 /TAXON_ID=418940 /ORGANISM="Scyphosphaera apsteinii, Strain RCC1455" /LENGTH=512 /DNA_ID=CAMNT_0007319875 /DNA_START=93 /DNA_END=1631 /DNA_ORIENTATION=-
MAGMATAGLVASHTLAEPDNTVAALHGETGQEVSNWSSTHSACPALYFQPDSPDEIDRIVQTMHQAKQKLRVVGSALSPNGLGLSDDAMLNMALCDRIISVDKEQMQVTVQAGARVRDVVEAIRPFGLTLQNYASIAEQQIGGFVSVGAHGTGACVPPVDEQVVRMRLHTPAVGSLELSEKANPRIFRLARVGLGALGIVSEFTLQCVPAHKLLQHTFTETRAGIVKRHTEHLQHKHMRYMWIPHTDTVVVVTCDPLPDELPTMPEPPDESFATAPLRELLLCKTSTVSPAAAAEMNFAQLRDALLALNPLDKSHVVEVNRAEAQFWQRSEGHRIDWSDKILGFECGGQQWVSEVVIPCGTTDEPNGRDLEYMQDLLAMVESSDLPTPSPIEQRWTLRSSSPMSPAHSPSANDLHSWVGIIMYLPTEDDAERAAITSKFWEYNDACRRRLWPKYGAHQHWAKIELPDNQADKTWVKRRLRERFPLSEFNELRHQFDPEAILVNRMLDEIVSD